MVSYLLLSCYSDKKIFYFLKGEFLIYETKRNGKKWANPIHSSWLMILLSEDLEKLCYSVKKMNNMNLLKNNQFIYVIYTQVTFYGNFLLYDTPNIERWIMNENS